MSHSVCETWRQPCLPLLLLVFRAPDWRTDHATTLSRRERNEATEDRWGGGWPVGVPLSIVWPANCCLFSSPDYCKYYCLFSRACLSCNFIIYASFGALHPFGKIKLLNTFYFQRNLLNVKTDYIITNNFGFCYNVLVHKRKVKAIQQNCWVCFFTIYYLPASSQLCQTVWGCGGWRGD